MSVEALDIVIATLLKTASSEVVKRGINSLSERLSAAFSAKNIEEIKSVAKEESSEEQLSRIAQANLDSSLMLPVAGGLAGPEYRSDFFRTFLNICFKVSAAAKTDVLLPGSIVDDKYMSMFCTRSRVPDLSRDGLNIDMDDRIDSFFSVLPCDHTDMEVARYHVNEVREFKLESSDYYSIRETNEDSFLGRRIQRVSAGSIYPRYPHSFTKLNVSLHNSGLKIGDYSSGIKKMIDFIPEYSRVGVLLDEDIEKIEFLLNKIKKFD